MANFQVFTYQFREDLTANQLDCFDNDYNAIDAKESMAKKQSLFEDEWKDEKHWVFKDGKAEYKHKLLEHRDHIIVFRIANNKTIMQETDFQVVEIDNKPSCMVVIDNRTNRQQVAVQKNGAFHDTITVAKILERVFSERMRKHKLVMEVNPRFKVNEFWDLVERGGAGVSYLKFTFTPKNLPWLLNRAKAVFNEIGENFQAETALELTSFGKAPLRVDRRDDLLKELLDVSAASGKVIKVRLMSYNTTYTCGENSSIVIAMDDSLIARLDDETRRCQLLIDDPAWEKVVEFVNEIKILHEERD